jgi:hypothetical protein
MNATRPQLKQSFLILNGLLYVEPEHIVEAYLLDTFNEALKHHDFWFDRSDDSEVFATGQVEYDILEEIMSRNHDLLFPIYQKYCKSKETK